MQSKTSVLVSGWTGVMKQTLKPDQLELVRERIFMERMCGALTVSNDGTVVSFTKRVPLLTGQEFEENQVTNQDVVDFTRMVCYLGLDFDPYYCMPFQTVQQVGQEDPTELFTSIRIEAFIKSRLGQELTLRQQLMVGV